ncbi:uncharacterized protein [Littorina saxatilis]|uniref:Right handed beta helix domain-containing protein n=1 Tax=Littorina saxatilis TaxID=31220 RepID=A0AAN9FVG3_9CAEN
MTGLYLGRNRPRKMSSAKVSRIFLFLQLWSVTCVWSAPVHIYVSSTGSDTNDGRTVSHPVKTLSHVVDMLAEDGIRGNLVFVELMQGYHNLTSTLHIQSTSGTVVFRAYQGQEVHVVGGTQIPSSQFHHVTDSHVQQRLPVESRDKVLELDLAAAGITDLGTLNNYGFAITWTAPLEIFINGNPLRLAEWPNHDFINIKSVPDGHNGLRFTYDAGGRDVNWVKETEPWVYGWWYWGWADRAVPVSHVEPQTHTITLKEKTHYGLRIGHYDPSKSSGQAGGGAQGGYFRVVNMLCELDQPGEYFIDRTNKKLYMWPNTPNQTLTPSDIVYASLVENCFLIESQAQQIQFEDFTVEACRFNGFELMNARNVTLKNMEIKNTGGNGVHCSGDCRAVAVLASDIHDVGGGVHISGGNRTTLTSSENVIRDNHIWLHSRYGAQANHAIKIGGVHAVVSHNHLHHGQYTGIWWSGNDHVIEYNHIHHMCWNSSDCGAIHSGRHWTWRGNVIRYNHVHDVQRHFPGYSVRGIMLDDQYSSVLIEHNVFYDNDVHIRVGGGRDNVIRYNVMYNALEKSVITDGRGLSPGHSTILFTRLEQSPYRTDVWKSRYPQLYSIRDHHPEAPEGNQIYLNALYYEHGVDTIDISGRGLDRKDYFDIHDNHRVYEKAHFWSPENADFRLRCDAAQWASGAHFPQPVKLDEVGPTVPTGPHYLRAHRLTPDNHTTQALLPCDRATVAPATHTPRGSYMPDGSAPNTLYPHIPKEGCWLVMDHCTQHPTAEGTHKDDLGTQNGTEEGCLARAAQQWIGCGSPSNGRVVAVYGPTGAMTFSAKGCYFAEWGCQSPHAGYIHRDGWAEQHENGANSEAACLRRASPEWVFCGSPVDRPFTSIYGPTGAFITGGPGCWIKIKSCPADRTMEGYFFDAWGDTNLHTGLDPDQCHKRAQYFWTKCGSHSNAPVTAYFRPKATSYTYP